MITRREFLGTAAFLSSCASLPADPYGGFPMAMESWCVRKFDLDRTLSAYRELGLRIAEIYPPSHMPVTADPEKIRLYREKLANADVAPWAVWGDFTRDHEMNRANFEFARALGARVIPGGVTPDGVGSLRRLAEEFRIPFAVHNDGPGGRYSTIGQVTSGIAEWSTRWMGACVDTGNFIRSGQDPVHALRTLGVHVHAVHLKDSDGKIMSTVMGRGRLDLVGTLRALREIGFRGPLVLEYEQNPDGPMEDLKECLARVREAVRQL